MHLSFTLEAGATATVAELEWCLRAVSYLLSKLNGTSVATYNLNAWMPLDIEGRKILKLSDLLQ